MPDSDQETFPSPEPQASTDHPPSQGLVELPDRWFHPLEELPPDDSPISLEELYRNRDSEAYRRYQAWRDPRVEALNRAWAAQYPHLFVVESPSQD